HARRGQQAKLIFEELKQGRIPPYSLYLRPFLTTGRLRVVNGRFRRRFLPSMDRFFGRRIDLETVFAIAHERAKHPLIAIGEVGFVSAAPKLVTADANWKEAFVRLAKGASAIIMVPLPRPSTVWVRLGVREPLEPFWEEIHRTMQDRGVQFPRMNPQGGLFFLTSGARFLHQITAAGFESDQLEMVLRGLINRANIDVICEATSGNDCSELDAIFDTFLYLSPQDGQLHARPVRLHDLLPFLPHRRLFDRLIDSGAPRKILLAKSLRI